MALTQGNRLGPYEVVARVGAGGMGEVYSARDTRLDRRVALKILHQAGRPDDPSRFEIEARAIAALNHPNICTLYDVGTQDGVPFLVMEYLEGRTLLEVLRGRPLVIESAESYAHQIADALSAAHARGIVHRDLKPGNIFVKDTGVVKILDFGLAKITEHMPAEAETLPVTRAGSFLGTMEYAAPEQLKSEPVDARTDVFAFGLVLYEMLTGKRAVGNATGFEAVTAMLRDEVAPLPETIPGALRAIVTRCLAKAAADRFPDGKAVLDALSRGAPLDDTPSPAAFPSIAVLPFADLSAAQDQEHFCDGVADELITALMTLDGLRVASRMSSFQFRGESRDVVEVGARLRVETVLEGSVRRAGNRLRITVRLTDVADGFQLWAERYDRTLDDIFAVQDEIADAVVGRLRASLAAASNRPVPIGLRTGGAPGGPRARRAPPRFDAYSAYLKGRHSVYRLTRESLARGVESFRRAIDIEPAYADPYAGLAQAYILQGLFSQAPPRRIMPRAKEAAERALALDGDLAEAHLSLAMALHWYEWDWPGAERSYRRAIELSPGDANARMLFSSFLSMRGRGGEAIAEARRAIGLDPLALAAHRALADALYFLERYDETIAEAERLIEFEPTFFSAYWMLGLAKGALGLYEEAVQVFDRGRQYSYGDAALEGYAGWARAMVGRGDEAREIAAQLKARRETGYVSAACIGQIYQGLGEFDEALEWYRRAHEERSGHCVGYRLMPLMAPLRTDPGFQALLDAIESGA